MASKVDDFEKALDKRKIEAYTGEYYWRARDIQFLLENCTWNRLYKSILRIKKNCAKENLDTSKDIIKTKTTINDGYERYTVDDFYLSNLIAYQLFAEYNNKDGKNKLHKNRGVKGQLFDKISKRPAVLYLFALITACIVVVFITVFSIFYVPFKPFRELRDLYIGTAMTTYSHQWLAKLFFSQETIDEVMNTQVAPDLDINTVKQDVYTKKENSIKLYNISGSNYEGKLLKISNPEQVFIGVSNTFGTRGEFIEDIVKDYSAIAGINGSGFIDENGKGKAAYPVGILISEGEWVFDPEYNEYDIVGLDYDNNLIVGTYTKLELLELNLRDAVEPFYKLIINGKNRISSGNGGYGLHPRTAIGQTLDGSILMLVIDGRQLHSIGATMKDCQDILAAYGATNAAALDGGSSSILYYNGEVQTKPSNGTTYGRYLPSAFLVKGN